MIPVAVVVSLAGVRVKVTVHFALGVVATRNRGIEPVFTVVARTQTVWIIAVDTTIAIIIGTVATLIGLALASRRETETGSSVAGLHNDCTVGNRSQIRKISTVSQDAQIIRSNR